MLPMVTKRNYHSHYLGWDLDRITWYRPGEAMELDLLVKNLESDLKIDQIVVSFEFGAYTIQKQIELRSFDGEQKIASLSFLIPINIRFGLHNFSIELTGKQKYGNYWSNVSIPFGSFSTRLHPDPKKWIFLSCSYDPADEKVIELAIHYAHACGLGVLLAREFERPSDPRSKVELLIDSTDGTAVIQTPRYTVNGQITAPWIIWEHGIGFSKKKLKLSLADQRVDLQKQGPLSDFQPTLRFNKYDLGEMTKCFSSGFAWLS